MAVALFLFGCSDNKQEQKKEVVAPQKPVKEVVKKEVVKPVEPKVAKVTKKEEPKALVVKKEVKEVAAPKTEVVEKKKQVVQAKAQKPAIDGASIFAKNCASCHGVKAEKKALTKSQVIQGWQASKVEAALQGYKAKTYGGTMKTIMENKAKTLSDDEIKALAAYISKLK